VTEFRKEKQFASCDEKLIIPRKDGNPFAMVRRRISEVTEFRMVQDFIRYEVRKPGGWQKTGFRYPVSKVGKAMADLPEDLPEDLVRIFGRSAH
jgi:hypothetical protein